LDLGTVHVAFLGESIVAFTVVVNERKEKGSIFEGEWQRKLEGRT
jgi:hypothetical protein